MDERSKIAGIGHNSLHVDDMAAAPHTAVTKAAIAGTADDVGGIAGKRLKSLIERIERLEDDKRAVAEDIKEVYAEAKGAGFVTKIVRMVIAERKKDVEKRREEKELLDLYWRATGGQD